MTFDENRVTALMEHVGRTILGDDWDGLNMDQRRIFKQNIVEMVVAIDEFAQAEPHKARRDDDVATWLKERRDSYLAGEEYDALDAALDDYRLHADTGTPLPISTKDFP